jgi:hypothetical protein
MTRQFLRRGQTGSKCLILGDDRGTVVTLLFMIMTGDDFQYAFTGKIEKPAAQRSHAEIDIAGSDRHGNRLRALKELEFGLKPLIGEIAPFIGDEQRCR